MSPTEDRPKWIDDMVHSLGVELGFDDLSLGEEGLFELDVQGTEIAIFYVPPSHDSGASFVVKSALDLPPHLPVQVLARLLATNLTTFNAGKGIVACDLDYGFWSWVDRIDLAGLTAPHLAVRLEQAANAARDWATLILPDLMTQSTGAPPADDSATPDRDDSIFLRL